MPQDLTPIHPELRRTLKRMPKFSFNRSNYWIVRLLIKLQRPPHIPEDIHIENILIPSQDPKVRIRVRTYRAKTHVAPVPVLLWVHGGGFILGTPELDDLQMVQFARALGIMIVSVDYRTAPAYPFPIPLEDCYTALKWTHTNAQKLGIDPERIAIGGESAGGGLAATLAQLAHDRAEVQPIFQLLSCPMLDDRTTLRSTIENQALMVWSPMSNRFGWESYLHQPSGLATAPPYAVAARREDLAGLPPTWIGVGTIDLFYEEDVAYAQRLKDSGVACEVVIVPGAFHGFDILTPQAQVVQEFRKSQIAALQEHLFPKS